MNATRVNKNSICKKVKTSAKVYWYASLNRCKNSLIQMMDKWEPPLACWIKCNVDAEIHLDVAWSTALFRNHLGKPIGGWVSVSHFTSV